MGWVEIYICNGRLDGQIHQSLKIVSDECVVGGYIVYTMLLNINND